MSDPARLAYPFGMAFGGTNNDLFVSDAFTGGSANAVLEYSPAGAYVRTIESGTVNQLTGLVIGPNVDLFVNSAATNQVVEFNATTSALVKVFATAVSTPTGIAFGNGNLYVTNGSNGSNTLYILNGTTGGLDRRPQ